MTKTIAPRGKVTLADLYTAGMAVVGLVNSIGKATSSAAVGGACFELEQEVAIAARHLLPFGAIPTPDPTVGATSNVVLQDVAATLKALPSPLTVGFLTQECNHAQQALDQAYNNAMGSDRGYALRVMKLHTKIPASLAPTLSGVHAKVARELALALAASKGGASARRATKKGSTSAKKATTKRKAKVPNDLSRVGKGAVTESAVGRGRVR